MNISASHGRKHSHACVIHCRGRSIYSSFLRKYGFPNLQSPPVLSISTKKNSNSTEKLPEIMYFTSAVLVLAGLSSVASAVAVVSYDDGMYHPDQPTTTAQVTTKATTYVSVISGTSKTSEYSGEPSSWYPTLSKSTYVGYWSQNATVTSSYKTTSTTTGYAMPSGVNNVTMTMKPGNFSTTLTMTDRM